MRLASLLLLAVSTLPSAAGAAFVEQLDQSLDVTSNPRYLLYTQRNSPFGQTFTCNQAGFLTRVAFRIATSPGVTEPITLGIYPLTATGAPNLAAAPLVTRTVAPGPVPFTGGFVSFDLSHAPPIVTPGLKLAAMYSTSQPYTGGTSPGYVFTVSEQNAGLYSGGDAWYWNSNSLKLEKGVPYDHAFRTYVTVPEPLALPAIALAAVLARRGCRRDRRSGGHMSRAGAARACVNVYGQAIEAMSNGAR